MEDTEPVYNLNFNCYEDENTCYSVPEQKVGNIVALNDLLILNKGLLVVHMNIRSLNCNFESFEIQMNNLKTKPDVIVLTETSKVWSATVFELKGYISLYNGSSINKCDGVYMYIKDTFRFTTSIDTKVENTKHNFRT